MEKTFDFVVYGATLEGLLIAEYLTSHGVRVVVLEPSQKPQLSLFDFYKSFDSTLVESLNLKAALTKFDIPFSAVTNETLTFEKGHFEPFVGFGENAPQNSDLISNFMGPNRITLTSSSASLQERFSKLDIRYSMNMTNINFNEQNIRSITLNDTLVYEAENFIFANNPVEILDLFDHNVVSQKFLQKLGRAEMPSTLLLNIKQKEALNLDHQSFVLYGTTKNPIVSVGRTSDKDSYWATFLSPESFDFNEDGVVALKEMKRQMKRALPELFQNIESEKITLVSKSHGYIDLKMEAFGKVQGVENLCLCSQFLVPGVNPVQKSLVAAAETRALIENFIEDSLDQLEKQEISRLNA